MNDRIEGALPAGPEPVLETARLRLRPLRAGDLDALLGVFGDPVVMAAFDATPFDRSQMQGWLEHALRHHAEHGYGLFAVIDARDGTLIGDCGLELMEIAGEPVAELGYDLRSDRWGRGLATEAATAMRDHAFTVLGLPKLVSLMRQGNVASRRVAEEVGMRHERDLDRGGVAYWLYAMTAQSSSPRGLTNRPMRQGHRRGRAVNRSGGIAGQRASHGQRVRVEVVGRAVEDRAHVGHHFRPGHG